MRIHEFDLDGTHYRLISEAIDASSPEEGPPHLYLAIGVGFRPLVGMTFGAHAGPDFSYILEKIGLETLPGGMYTVRVATMVFRYLLGFGLTPFRPSDLPPGILERNGTDWVDQFASATRYTREAGGGVLIHDHLTP